MGELVSISWRYHHLRHLSADRQHPVGVLPCAGHRRSLCASCLVLLVSNKGIEPMLQRLSSSCRIIGNAWNCASGTMGFALLYHPALYDYSAGGAKP